jgi:hypothetical protein
MRLIRSLLSACLLASAIPSQAKCPFVHYSVEGRVSIPPGADREKIKIYLFLNGSTQPSDYPPEPGLPDFAVLKEDGTFQADAWLNTSALAGNRCDRVETMADIFLTGDNVQGRRVTIKFLQPRKVIRKDLRAFARSPNIQLETLDRSKVEP